MIINALISAFGQLLVVLILGFIFYKIHQFVSKHKERFFEYVGIKTAINQFDKTYRLILIAVILFAVVSTYIQFNAGDEARGYLTGDNSPYGKILKNEFSITSIILGVLYCFIQAGASEEILFRGLIGRRLFSKFGNFKGNLIQAFIFWIMHLLIFRLMTGSWISWFQVYAFIASFGLGLASGFVNYRKNGNSIMPSWLLHSLGNFITFLTLSCLLKL